MFFRVDQPRAPETPLVVEVPHAGIQFDPESLALCAAPARSIGRDADLLVDELFVDAPDTGATLIAASSSRYVCDLNRGVEELDSTTTPVGTAQAAPHGVIWRRTTEGRPALSGPLSRAEVERRLELVYRPYHATLARLVAEKKARFGYVILLCGHSMPSFGRLGDRRADVVPGTRGRTTAAPSVISLVDELADASTLSVAHDEPYRGGYTTGLYGRPTEGCHALQIELARRLYMDESTLARNPEGFARTRAFCKRLIEALGRHVPSY